MVEVTQVPAYEYRGTTRIAWPKKYTEAMHAALMAEARVDGTPAVATCSWPANAEAEDTAAGASVMGASADAGRPAEGLSLIHI